MIRRISKYLPSSLSEGHSRPSITTAYLASLQARPGTVRAAETKASRTSAPVTEAAGQHRPPPLLPEAQGTFEAFDIERRG